MKLTSQFLTLFLIASNLISQAQVNKRGTIYASAGIGGFTGTGNFNVKARGYSENSSAFSAAISAGLKGQYAFASKWSVGIYFRTNATGYVNALEDENWNSTNATQLMLGLDAKYYLLNRIKVALTLGPQIGIVTSNEKLEYEYGNGTDEFDGKSSGINYGLNFGVNFFWSQHVGLFLDVGLNGSNLKGDFNDAPTSDYSLSNFGVAGGVGIIAKFGGTPPAPRPE